MKKDSEFMVDYIEELKKMQETLKQLEEYKNGNSNQNKTSGHSSNDRKT